MTTKTKTKTIENENGFVKLAQIKDIKRLIKKIPNDWALCQLFEGTRRAAEAEMMVAQTIHACGLNLKEHGEAFSWRGDGVFSSGHGGLVDNGTAYGMLVDREYFVEEERDGKTIIRMTQRLIHLLDGHFAKKKP